jgi:hypothetical protein
MSSAFPTTSTLSTEVSPGGYDITQILRAVTLVNESESFGVYSYLDAYDDRDSFNGGADLY